VIPAFRRLRQEKCEFQVILSYIIETLSQKKQVVGEWEERHTEGLQF
jgi:hypothetical protein